MTASQNKQKAVAIAVAGDRLVDWGLVSSNAAVVGDLDLDWIWHAGAAFQLAPQSAGVETSGELLVRICREERLDSVAVRLAPLPPAALTDPRFPQIVRTFSVWAPLPGRGRDPHGRAWRMERIIGRATATAPLEVPAVEAGAAPDFVAFLDLDLGFRDDPLRFRPLLGGKNGPEVFLRTTAPLGTGKLWRELCDRHADRLTVVIDAGDLRRASLRVEQPLSWEHIYDHVVAAVTGSPLSAARCVVVTLGLSGAVVIERGATTTLVFDPRLEAGELQRPGAGFVIGHQQVMLAALVRGRLLGDGATDAVRRGMDAMRDLHGLGFDAVGEPGQELVSFPFDRVVGTIHDGRDELSCVSLTSEQLATSSILVESLAGDRLERAARSAAHEGAEGLKGVPVETAGAWSSVDRTEIENLRSVRAIMADYVESFRAGRTVKRPLSVAVFGPPGAGKSFAVKQVASSLLPGRLRVIEFNLSQLPGEHGLAAAFHMVRDAVLEQRLPLVFWDEFDTPLEGAPLGWLRSFLMPMQDAAFVDGDVSHPLGPAIFVFAGGTCATFAEFATGDSPDDRRAKKSDFISRLRGYMDVLGPNPNGPHDAGVKLRRALLLRALLQKSAPQVFREGRLNIDEGVLTAFLRVAAFHHGARSVEAIVDMSALGGKASYERASLPAPRQLALHVDADAFLDLVNAG
jgi:hypothetical protein